LKPKRYLFYPANFWAHKNHGILLQAFQLFRQKHPESDLKIVLTGALDDRREMLVADAKRMGLDAHVITPGFLPDREIGILYGHAKGLIFPSLYEGFGIPLLEAMQAGIPVACSNVTSLPEIGDEAVLYFNPRDASEVGQSIEALEFNEELRNELIRKGHERLLFFGDARVMAQSYASLIRRIISSKRKIYAYGLHGLTEDRWFQENAYLSFPASSQERFLEFSIQVPTWIPNGQTLTITRAGVQLASYRCDRGGKLAASLALPSSSDMLEMHFSTAYVPAGLGIANDNRPLSALCESLRIKSADDTLLFTPFRVDPNR